MAASLPGATPRHRGAGLRRDLGRRVAARRVRLGRPDPRRHRFAARSPPASSTSGPPRPAPVAESFHRIDKAYPGRFLLGHRRRPPRGAHRVQEALRRARPSTSTSSTSTACPRTAVVVAALGPQVLKLSARRSAGAHPYLTDARAHRTGARAASGPMRSWPPSTRWC